jgi:anti-sigma factor RsiW
MKCDEVRKNLQSYIDGILDDRSIEKVEAHLAECTGCTNELELLREYSEEMGSLSKVEPPEDFLKELHERLERRSSLKGVLRTLFVPAKIKLPVEFAAVATAVIALLLVLNVIVPSQREPLPTPELREDEVAASTEGPVGTESAASTEGPVGTESAASAESAAESDTTVDLDAAAEKSVERPVKETIKITLYFSTDPTKDLEDRTEAAGIAPSLKRKMEAAQETEGLAGTDSAESDEGPAGKPLPGFHVELLSAIENLLVGAGGTILYMDYEMDPDMPASITATLPPAHLEGFIETLGQIGEIETTYETSPDKPSATENGMTEPTFLEVPAEEPSVWILIYPKPSPGD